MVHGSEREFERIYLEYSGRVQQFLFRLSGDAGLTEEMTQETFFQAYRSLHRYRGECGMLTWLISIAKNVFLHELRKSRREVLSADAILEELAAPEEEQPGYQTIRHSEIERVRKAIADLPARYADVLVLRVYGDVPYEQIAARLGISVSSAKVIYFRAKQKLREALE